jgi:hypothetical protein
MNLRYISHCLILYRAGEPNRRPFPFNERAGAIQSKSPNIDQIMSKQSG